MVKPFKRCCLLKWSRASAILSLFRLLPSQPLLQGSCFEASQLDFDNLCFFTSVKKFIPKSHTHKIIPNYVFFPIKVSISAICCAGTTIEELMSFSAVQLLIALSLRIQASLTVFSI